jgi:Tfp pilus assembly protein PilX
MSIRKQKQTDFHNARKSLENLILNATQVLANFLTPRKPAVALAPVVVGRTLGCYRARRNERGVALILVMLAVLVLSVLVAGIVFSSRSETLASYNYKLNTEADYLAKAGIQEALNWFRSQNYVPMTQSQAALRYQAGVNSVTCILGCPAIGSVQFVTFGPGQSNYPNNVVSNSFASSLSNVRVTGDANNSGTFSVNAVLLSYQYINAAQCSRSWDPTPCPAETWLITSQGTWTGRSSSSATAAKAVEKAIVQTLFSGTTSSSYTFTNAIYALCSVTMNGSAGTCTDAYDSKKGPYGGGLNPAGSCDSSSPNIIDTGASVGSNGGVTFTGNVTAGGNVIIGTGAPAGCPTGYSGSAKNVLGKVVTGSQVVPPPLSPPFPPANYSQFASNPGAAPSYTGNATLGAGATIPCVSGVTCNGTSSNPYLINNINISGKNSITLVGGTSSSPAVYYINTLSESGQAQINVTGPGGQPGYVILNVLSTLSITGQGLVSNSNNLPAQVIVNDNCNGCNITLSGNGAISAVVDAPGANVTLSGGGSSGYSMGAILANNVTMSGGRPLHYDTELGNLSVGGGPSGTLSPPLITTYSRQKF